MKSITTMTAKEVLDEVKKLPDDKSIELMRKFIERLHPTTMTLPAPLKRK